MHLNAPLVYVICGESSGDQLAADVLRALRVKLPSLRIRGVTGPALESLGVESFASYHALALTGITEIVSSLPALWRLAARLEADIRHQRPAMLLLVDAPGFNLRFVQRLQNLNMVRVQLVSPQIWAWRPDRVNIIKKYVNHILLLFAFEQALYARVGVPHTWIGHPLVERQLQAAGRLATPSFHERHPVVALLPGSRPHELRRHLPPLLQAARLLHQRQPQLSFTLVVAPGVDRRWLRHLLERLLCGQTLPLRWEEKPVMEVLPDVRAAWVASGTATLEAALSGTPHVVIYKVSWWTWWVGRLLVRGVEGLGMGNILAGKKLVPELLQRLDPSKLVSILECWLTDPHQWQEQHQKLLQIRTLLGPPGAATRAAEVLEQLLNPSSTSLGAPTTPPDQTQSDPG